ncbi:MAG: ATP-binding protein [Phycisphaerae bacterium]
MKLQLSHKVNLAILMTFLLVAVVFALIIIPLQQIRTANSIAGAEEFVSALVQRERQDLANEIYERRSRALQIRLQELVDLQAVFSVAVYDRDGQALQRAAKKGIPAPAANIEPLEDTSVTRMELGGVEAMRFDQPIRAAGETLGYIRVSYSLAEQQRERTTAYLLFGAFLLSALAIMMITLNLMIWRTINKPIQSLTAAMGRAEQRGPGEKVDIHSSDEVGELAEAYNQMSGRLKETLQKLQSEVAERILAEDALRQREGDLRITLDSIGDAVIATDADTTITRMNPVAEKLTGYQSEEAIGLPLREVFQVETPDGREVACPARIAVETGSPTGIPSESVLVSRDGKRTDIADSASPIRDPEGRTVGAVLVFRDVTNQKQLETQLRQAQKMEAVGQLAGGIAHDFNNLLQAIQGYTELCLTDVEDDDHIRGYLEEVRKASQRAADLTRQLLTFSRRETLQPKLMDINVTINNLTKILRRVIGEHIDLRVHCGQPLDAIYADPGQIEQVIMNLCVNARDAMPEGGTLTIRTGNATIDKESARNKPWAEPGKYVVLSVADNGKGIATEEKDRIFEPFYTTKEVGQGTGLGLATVYGIAKRHDGLIHLESNPGNGADFQIYFPSAGSTTDENSYVPTPTERKRREQHGGSGTILLAEDDELVRNLSVKILQKAGYELLVAEDGKDACDLLLEHTDEIDLAVLDVIMPRVGGRDVYREIRAQGLDIPVIFSSGYSYDAAGENSLPDDSALIQKPYSPDDLLGIIRKSLLSNAEERANQ